MEKYRCRQCAVHFKNEMIRTAMAETKCPVCQSEDIERTEISREVLEYLRHMMSSGGG